MIIKKIFAIAFVLVVTFQNVENVGAWTRYGGDPSCGFVWKNEGEPAYRMQFKAWSFGFISALNDLMQATWNNPPDEEGIWQAVVLHCRNNPLDDLYTATVAVWGQITQRQTK